MTALSPLPARSDSSLIARLEQHARARAEEPGLIFLSEGVQAREVSWAMLWERVRALGGWLARGGVSSGDVLFVLSASPYEQVLGLLGAMAAGALPSILSFPSLKQTESRFHETVQPIARSTGARWILSSGEFVELIQRAGLPVGVIGFPSDEAPGVAGGPPLPPPAQAFLQFSSGTTGLRKCVRISDGMLAHQAAAYARALDLGPEDRIVSWLPLYHDMGLVACLLVPLYQGNLSIHMSPFEWLADPTMLLLAVSRYRATLIWLPNFAYKLCADQVQEAELPEKLDLGCLRAVINCSEPVRERSHALFVRRFGRWGLREEHLQACYAMAEATFAVTQTALGRPARVDRVQARAFSAEHRALPAAADTPEGEVSAFVSCGRPIEGMQVRIGEAGEERRVGEIQIRGGSVIPGYGIDGHGGSESFTEDGWYRTGDLGYVADGELFVTGRAKELIIHRGHNVYPLDVEEVVAEVPGCKPGRAVAFGLFDEEQGTEEVVVMVEPDDAAADPGALARQARERVWSRLNVAVLDVDVCAPGSLLKSTSGKLSRSANRTLYLERREAARRERGASPRPAGARPYVEPRELWEQQLAWIWEEVLGKGPIGVDDNLFLELGADSVSTMRVAAEVQRRLSRVLQPTALLGAESIARQAELLRRAQDGANTTVVTLQRKGTGRPFFLVHAAGGWAFPYVALARHLGEDRPIHAFQAPQLFLDDYAELTVEGMARDYLAAMKAMQPEGPYLLGGWSFGGGVAFEMANRLCAAGEQVAGLVLFDTDPPSPLKTRLIFGVMSRLIRAAFQLSLRLPAIRRGVPPLQRLEKLSPVWRFFFACALSPGRRDIRPLIEFAFPDTCDRRRLAELDTVSAWDYVLQLARANPQPVDQVLLIPGLDGVGIRRALAVSTRLEELNVSYQPRWRYAGAVDIIGVSGNPMLQGWRRFVEGRLDIHSFEVKKRLVNAHFDMMEEQNVRLFAGPLREILRRADG